MESVCESIEPGTVKYTNAFKDKSFYKIGGEMLKTQTEKKRWVEQSDKTLELIRKAFLETKCPHLDDIFSNSKFAQKTIDNRRKELSRSEYIDENGQFLPSFFEEYIRLVSVEEVNVAHHTKIVKTDGEIETSTELSKYFTYEDIVELLERNPRLRFTLPADMGSEEDVDFLNPRVQFVNLSHMSVGNRAPLGVNFFYICPECGQTLRTEKLLQQSPKCVADDCKYYMKRDPSRDFVLNTRVSQIMIDSETIPVFSLVDLPDGEFKAGFIMRRDPKNTKYSGFIVAVEKREYNTDTLCLSKDTHAVWQICDIIDDIHDKQDMRLYGMDYVKASVVLAAFANACGEVSWNCMYIGKAGMGKSSIPEQYVHTLSLNSILQGASGTSAPGLIGSADTLEVNGTPFKVIMPGVFLRHDLVVLDEIYSADDELLEKLKTDLGSKEIRKNVSGYPGNGCLKKATVFATANIDAKYQFKVNDQFEKLREALSSGIDNFKKYSRYAERACKLYPLSTDPSVLIPAAMYEEYNACGVNWVDGKETAIVDRFPFIFYIGQPQFSNLDPVSSRDTNENSSHVGSGFMHAWFYSQSIKDYLQFCSKIKVKDFTDIQHDKNDALHGFLRQRDMVHSPTRLMVYLKRFLKLSAAINGRDTVNDDDYAFVKDFWLHTCCWKERNELKKSSMWTESGRIIKSTTNPHDAVIKLKERDNKINEYIASRLGDYDLNNDEMDVLSGLFKQIVHAIQIDFGADSMEAHMFLENYVKTHRQSDVEYTTDQTIEWVDMCSHAAVFEESPVELSQGGISKYLADGFAKHRRIKKVEIEQLSERFGFEPGWIDLQIKEWSSKGIISLLGTEYKWNI